MSHASCTRSGEPATSFAPRLPPLLRQAGARLSASFDRLPIRVRLAGVSALLTFVILCPTQMVIGIDPLRITPPLADLAPSKGHAIIRIFTIDGRLVTSQPDVTVPLGEPREGARNINGYRVISRLVTARFSETGERAGEMIMQYAQPFAATEATVKRVELGLLAGVIIGSVLALGAGMAIAHSFVARSAAKL